jgi:hypothetical protein
MLSEEKPLLLLMRRRSLRLSPEMALPHHRRQRPRYYRAQCLHHHSCFLSEASIGGCPRAGGAAPWPLNLTGFAATQYQYHCCCRS